MEKTTKRKDRINVETIAFYMPLILGLLVFAAAYVGFLLKALREEPQQKKETPNGRK